MKIEPQATADLVRLGELIADMPVAMLTSVGDDGALVSCPMEALEMDAEGASGSSPTCARTSPSGVRAVNLAFVDDARGTYVSISGRGEIAKDALRIERLWTASTAPPFPTARLAPSRAAQGRRREGRVLGCAEQPHRAPAVARGLGRRRHADRPGRPPGPDRPSAPRRRAPPPDEKSARGLARGTRWPLATLGVVAALVVAVLVCEALGWPFLVSPVQHWLASDARPPGRVQRRGGRQERRARRLLRGVRVDAQRIEIGAPAWSKAPYMLLAAGRAPAPRLPRPLARLARRAAAHHGPRGARARRHARAPADGRASWQFGKKRPAAETPSAARCRASPAARRQGPPDYVDEVLPGLARGVFRAERWQRARRGGGAAGERCVVAERHLRARRRCGEERVRGRRGGRARPGERGLRLNAFGNYRKLPVRVELNTSGVLGLLEEGSEATEQPLRLLASVGRANLSFEGTTTDPLHFAGLKGRFTVSGASLAAVGDALGITLPTTPPFKTRGTLVKDGGLWKAVFDDATIGTSRLAGAFTYDGGARCRCSPDG
jgi:general stress protein 26